MMLIFEVSIEKVRVRDLVFIFPLHIVQHNNYYIRNYKEIHKTNIMHSFLSAPSCLVMHSHASDALEIISRSIFSLD